MSFETTFYLVLGAIALIAAFVVPSIAHRAGERDRRRGPQPTRPTAAKAVTGRPATERAEPGTKAAPARPSTGPSTKPVPTRPGATKPAVTKPPAPRPPVRPPVPRPAATEPSVVEAPVTPTEAPAEVVTPVIPAAPPAPEVEVEKPEPTAGRLVPAAGAAGPVAERLRQGPARAAVAGQARRRHLGRDRGDADLRRRRRGADPADRASDCGSGPGCMGTASAAELRGHARR